jgi:hypothetical protein
MTHLTKILVMALFALFVSVTFAQEKPDTQKKEVHKHMENMKSDSTMHSMHHSMKMKSDSTKVNEIVRNGEIDLKAIDKNNDGKVYQDMMDWNVISDKPGQCPLCGMTLEKVTLKEAKENLLNNNFKVKENK